MRKLSGLGALVAAALVSGAASATPITVGASKLVIDVEFWGRQQITSQNPDPNRPDQDIVSYGDPVQGTFRISTADAPAPIPSFIYFDNPNARVYGSDSYSLNPSPASFVTSSWTSTFAFHRDVLPVPGGEASDYVTIADGIRLFPDEPRKDRFHVVDAFTANPGERDEIRHDLAISVSTPRDIIQGVGLDQEFELVDPEENGGGGYGFFRTTVNGVHKFFDFIVDRVHVSKHLVCRP